MTMLAWIPGPWEMAMIAIVALLFFGKRLPEVARGFGKTVNEFKKGLNEAQSDFHSELYKATDEVAKAGSDAKKDQPV